MVRHNSSDINLGREHEKLSWSSSEKGMQGDIYLEEKKREFIYLKQGHMSMSEYKKEFIRLSRYAREIIPTEEIKYKRFK